MIRNLERLLQKETQHDNLRILSDEIQDSLTNIARNINHTHPNKDLEHLIFKVFERVPGVKSVRHKKGRADRGADLLVELEFGEIPDLVQTIVVQIKSWDGELYDTSAIEDIKNAFDYYENANMGLIVSTATRCSDHFQNKLDKFREEEEYRGKPVSLLIGADLALFCLRYGGDLL